MNVAKSPKTSRRSLGQIDLPQKMKFLPKNHSDFLFSTFQVHFQKVQVSEIRILVKERDIQKQLRNK